MTKLNQVREKVRQVVLENLNDVTPEELSDNIELFSMGLNSINAVSLVLGLEEAFGFEFDMEEISYESFRAIADIVKLIENKAD